MYISDTEGLVYTGGGTSICICLTLRAWYTLEEAHLYLTVIQHQLHLLYISSTHCVYNHPCF